MKRFNIGLAAAALAILGSAPTALAQHRFGHDRNIAHFHNHDFRVWRGGHWIHGWHGEHFGWWWTFGPRWWYRYPAPIYPYPDPYIPPSFGLQPAPPAGRYWYYCSNPQGYYPYVPSCSVPWQRMAPAP